MKKKAYQSVFMVLLSSGCGQSIYIIMCICIMGEGGGEKEREGERKGGREREGGGEREKERENGWISNTTQVIILLYSTLT